MTTRKQYTKEFKLDAVSLVTEQGYTRAEAARRLEINANMLTRWIKELSDTEGQAFRGNGNLTPEQEELKKLRAQVKRLKMEKDILKKATVDSTGQCNTYTNLIINMRLFHEASYSSTFYRKRKIRSMGSLEKR